MKTGDKVYIVKVCQGSWEDYIETHVVAYLSKKKAETHVAAGNALITRVGEKAKKCKPGLAWDWNLDKETIQDGARTGKFMDRCKNPYANGEYMLGYDNYYMKLQEVDLDETND